MWEYAMFLTMFWRRCRDADGPSAYPKTEDGTEVSDTSRLYGLTGHVFCEFLCEIFYYKYLFIILFAFVAKTP